MPQTPTAESKDTAPSRRLLLLLLTLPILAALTSVWALDHAKTHRSLFAMTSLVGPTTRSLLAGGGLTACTEEMGTRGNPICFHAARMPATAVTIALGVRLFGDRYLAVAIFKTLLFLLPIELATLLVWRWLPVTPQGRLGVVLLLLAPFSIVPFLADVSNMLVDEGYSYSFLALAVALLLFPTPAPATRFSGTGQTLLFALSLDGLYLAKSGMFAAVLVLLAGFLLLERSAPRRTLVLLLVAAAPLGWALHQHHATGRYSFGTSFDGINLHKGNNEAFLQNYPPREGDSLDWYDFQLNHGRQFRDEWSYNDFHRHAALAYLRAHPRQTLQGGLRKLDILWFSCRKVGSTASHGLMKLFEDAGLLLFRLLFWTAFLAALYLLPPGRPHLDTQHRVPHPSRLCEGWDTNSVSAQKVGCLRACPELAEGAGPSDLGFRTTTTLRLQAAIFLATVFACTLPYVAGFAYTRHVSVLVYPSALFCCRLLSQRSHCLPPSS